MVLCFKLPEDNFWAEQQPKTKIDQENGTCGWVDGWPVAWIFGNWDSLFKDEGDYLRDGIDSFSVYINMCP